MSQFGLVCVFAFATLLSPGMHHTTCAEEPSNAANATEFQPAIAAQQIRPHIEFLASKEMAGRSGATKDKVRNYIVQQWRSAGLQALFSVPLANSTSVPFERERVAVADALAPSVPSFEQPIPGDLDEAGRHTIDGHNIGAILPGSDPVLKHELIVIGAHYDHLGIRNGEVFAGADDNASGVSMLIEVSRQLAIAKPAPKRTVVFVGFDLEERMLWGSRWFAAHPPWPIDRVKLFITADMIGRSLGNLPLPAVFVMGSERASELRTALSDVGAPTGLEVFRLGTDIVGTRSDYGPFRDREIPFLFFSTGEHPDYHTPRDTPDRIDFDKVAHIASLILKITGHVADAEHSPVWSQPASLDLEEPRILLRITSLLLEIDKQRPLTATQRFFVTNVRNRAMQIIESKRITPDERTWLIRMSQLLMLSVF